MSLKMSRGIMGAIVRCKALVIAPSSTTMGSQVVHGARRAVGDQHDVNFDLNTDTYLKPRLIETEVQDCSLLVVVGW